MDRLKKQMDFLIEIDKLKEVFRQSLLFDMSRHENDSEHSWHLAMFCIILSEYAQEGTDILQCIKLVLIHDLVEIYAGDTYLYDEEGYKDKEERERKAADRIFNILPKPQNKEIMDLWLEFEQRNTKESKFANILDRIQPIMLNYMSEGKMWKKNNIAKSQVIERAEKMGLDEGNEKIREYILDIIEKSAEKGYLRNE